MGSRNASPLAPLLNIPAPIRITAGPSAVGGPAAPGHRNGVSTSPTYRDVPLCRRPRGGVSDDRLNRVAGEVAAQCDEPLESIGVLDANDWLSTPRVVNDSYLLKIITGQNSAVRALLTTGRNLGVFAPGFRGCTQKGSGPRDKRHILARTQ